MFSEYDGFQTNPMHKTRSESDYIKNYSVSIVQAGCIQYATCLKYDLAVCLCLLSSGAESDAAITQSVQKIPDCQLVPGTQGRTG